MKSADIRQTFLDFFESKGHTIVPSASMINRDDPTLMFTNAGMNPFKEYFLGQAVPKDLRVADTQKCLRVSGKHNDLEEVGVDTYHHTFFEMLGNWSFGDYFKKEAVSWAWELLTEVYKINPENLYATIFEGAPEEGIAIDQEAKDLWKNFLPEERILLGNKKDNFWEMGEQGPCGPCSEIHVDLRSEEEKTQIPGAELVNQDHPQVIEIWNLVFIQFNRKANGSLEELPEKHIDTGMGFERLCMVLQGKTSNYDTDVFTPIIREIETRTGIDYGANEETDKAIRVVSDHLRTVYFSIADGQLPSNTGAGYVIRRILRRAVRYAYTFLGQNQPILCQLVPTLSDQMGAVFPELKKQQYLAENVIREEELSFLKTLEQGLHMLDGVLANSPNQVVPGDKVFELYDTFGFPQDLTALIASERGYEVDQQGFEQAMEAQKNRSKAAAQQSTDDWVILKPIEEMDFVGYDTLEIQTSIAQYRKVNTKKDGDFYQIVLTQTPFYPEGGGQVGDKGYLEMPNGALHYVVDTKKENNLILHYCKTLPDALEETIEAAVDQNQRRRTAANHTATHLLHQALRSVLGDHIEQKGSMVHSGIFRFDFSHFSKMTADELHQVESFVNARIQEQLPLEEKRQVAYQQALKEGAIALFGEKYGDEVRSIRFGQSMELCGGTHVDNTSAIWHFKILSEGAVAAGIRRIEAITGDAVKDYFQTQTEQWNLLKGQLKNPQDPLKAVEQLQMENQVLKKEIAQLQKLKIQMLNQEMQASIQSIGELSFLSKQVDLDAQGMKDLAFGMGQKFDNLVMVLGTVQNEKPLLCCYISKALVESKSLDAGQVVRTLGKHIQGGGGGQPFFATAGGKNSEGLATALAEAKSLFS